MNKDLELKIDGGDKLPLIKYLPLENKLIIKGRSIAEYINDFYMKMFNWLDLYMDHYIDNSININDKLNIIIELEYVNTPSIRMLVSLMKKLNHINCNIIWYYEEDDETMYDLAFDLMTVTNKTINLVPIYD